MGYQLIEHIDVGAGGAASIEFTGIPQDGVDLNIELSARSSFNSASTFVKMEFNGVTTGYNTKRIIATGAAVSTSAVNYQIASSISAATTTANTFGSGAVYIANYTSTGVKRSSSESASEDELTTNSMYLAANSSSATAAILSVKLTPFVGNFTQYSTASLYKITAD
jgi:hypothetical protein